MISPFSLLQVCAAGEGDRCGGPWNISGRCASNLKWLQIHFLFGQSEIMHVKSSWRVFGDLLLTHIDWHEWKRCERPNTFAIGKCLSNHSSCQETRTELKAAKRKMGFNYQQFLTAREKWERLKRAVKGDCSNGESASCPHIYFGFSVCDCIGYSIGRIPFKR